MATNKTTEPKRATKAAPSSKAAPPSAPAPAAESAPLNREQRRRQKFGKAGNVHQHNPLGPWPEVDANPALRNVTGAQADDGADTTVTAAGTSTDAAKRQTPKTRA